MPLKRALKNSSYWLTASPISKQKKLPGNMGTGMSNDADTKIMKKANRIIAPFIVDLPAVEVCVFSF